MEKTKMEKEIIKTIISNFGCNEAENLSNALSHVVANYDYEAVQDWCTTITGEIKHKYVVNLVNVTKAIIDLLADNGWGNYHLNINGKELTTSGFEEGEDDLTPTHIFMELDGVLVFDCSYDLDDKFCYDLHIHDCMVTCEIITALIDKTYTSWDDGVTTSFKYPIFMESFNSNLVVKFTSLCEGEVIIGDEIYDIGTKSASWTKHTDPVWVPQAKIINLDLDKDEVIIIKVFGLIPGTVTDNIDSTKLSKNIILQMPRPKDLDKGIIEDFIRLELKNLYPTINYTG